MEYSPEFELVLACLRWPLDAAGGERIRRLAQQPIDWTHLLQIVQHHKVVPLFARNFSAAAAGCMPEEAAAELRAATIANAHACQQRRGQLVRLHRLFREQQIDVRILKGIPLAITGFQDATLRDAGDIDLLVAKEHVFGAGAVLAGEGYVRYDPQARLTPRRLRSYMAHQKDLSFEHPATGTVIDLHWRLFRNAYLPSDGGIEDMGEELVDLGSECVSALPTPRLLLYLCIHGALDGWLRLKWLADIGALLHTMSAGQLAAAANQAVERQALPHFSAAVLLCQDLLGPHPAPAVCLPREDRRVRHILRFGKALMTSNHYQPVREKIVSSRWFVNEFRLHGSMRYRLDLVLRTLFRPRAWSMVDLPDALFPLYALLSPVEWLTFRLRRRFAPLRRATGRSIADVAMAVEAGCMLLFFRVALNFVPVQKLSTWMSGAPGAASADSAAQTLRRVEWSIDTVLRHVPLTFVCFPQCLAAYFMLRRRHIASKLFYGVTRDADQLKAHTWVKVGERTVVGGDVAARFTVLTTFP